MAAVYLLCLVAGLHADQVNCIKWKDIAGNTVGTYCKPFQVRAGNGIQFSDDGYGKITITSTGAVAGAGGSDTQVNFNSSGVLGGSSGLIWNNSTSTLTATHITGLDSKPFIDVVRDCGATGDGVTDDSTVVQACFDAHQGYAFYFPKTQANNSCSYFFGTTLAPKGDNVSMFGANGGFRNFGSNSAGTSLCFAAGITGIKFDSGFPSGASIHDLNLQGLEGTTFMTDSTKINFPSGANLPQTTRSIATIQRTSNVLTVTITAAGGQEGLFQSVGSQVLISGVTGDATMNGRCIIATLTNTNSFSENPAGFTCAQNGSDAGPFTTPGTVSLPTSGASAADGIRVCVNFLTIYRVGIKAFGRHGINADAVSGHGCTNPFADALVVRDSILYNNQGDGYYGQGTDSNVNLLEGNQLYYNMLWGGEDQSGLGNTWVMNNFSNNGAAWVGSGGSTPATKAISTISRTLVSGVSTVTVVLSAANTSVKQGSCIVIAGVTDSTFNTAAGQCYFVTAYTDSTHFQWEQPGAPVDASSSSGTVRMSKFVEAFLSAGLTNDSGGPKMETQSPSSQTVAIYNYVEGAQPCKMNVYAISIGGPTGGCNTTQSTWTPGFINVQGSGGGGLAGSLEANIKVLTNVQDQNYVLNFRPGLASTARDVLFNFLKYDNSVGWVQDVGTQGTNGDTSSWIVSRNGVRRFGMWAINNSSGITRLNSESTGAVQINNDANTGTGGLLVASGGASPSTVATVSSAGKGTFNGGLVINNVAAPTVSANQIGFGSTTDTAVGAAGAASALPATPSGYIIVNIAGTNFKIPYYAN